MNRMGITVAMVFGVLFLLATVSFAFAKENERSGDNNQVGVSAQLQARRDMQAENKSEPKNENSSGNSSKRAEGNNSNNNDVENAEADDETDMDDNNDDGMENESEKHRSEVADIVLSLKALAGKDGGIGNEVRKVAQEQSSSSLRTVEVMRKIEARSALMNFLFGADFKNLGTLRSELATTQNHIEQLTKAKSETVSADVKAGIDVQINALQKANADANAFVEAHADTFSLFGWFVRFFNK